MINSLNYFFFFVFIMIPCHGYSQEVPPVVKGSTALEVSTDQIIQIQVVPPADPELPTFALLPGIHRALFKSEAAIEKLRSLGYGVILMSFSPQPFSITLLPKNTVPYFLKNEMSLGDLANEAEFAIRWAQEKYSLKTVVPVSLSFSGAVSSFLKNHPLVIDVVPMTSNAAANPELEQIRQGLLTWEFWNPFLKAANRITLDNAYRSYWNPKVYDLSQSFGFHPSQLLTMVEGYTLLSRASEGFEWDNETDAVNSHARRIFVLAQNESPLLLKSQLAAFKKLNTKNPLLVIVEGSGHVIPSDRPEAYAKILGETVTGKLKSEKGFFVFTKAGTLEKITENQVEEFLKL